MKTMNSENPGNDGFVRRKSVRKAFMMAASCLLPSAVAFRMPATRFDSVSLSLVTSCRHRTMRYAFVKDTSVPRSPRSLALSDLSADYVSHKDTASHVRILGVEDAVTHMLPRNGHHSNELTNGKVQVQHLNGVAVPTRLNGNKMIDLNGKTQPMSSKDQLKRDDESLLPDIHGRSELVANGHPVPQGTSGHEPPSAKSAWHVNDVSSIQEIEQNVGIPESCDTDESQSTGPLTVRTLWKRRHARSIQEGIRREKTTQLSTILSKTPLAPQKQKRRYAARTITGLINALAEEADGLEVEVDARSDTPFWSKHVNSIRINFSRLGFKPLRMGGLDEAIRTFETQIADSRKNELAVKLELSAVSSADEAFDRIDVDKSGALDPDEIAKALNLAASSNSDEKLLAGLASQLTGLASQLVQLYDSNGDGVVDREEYQSLVADMAALRQAEKLKQEEREKRKVTNGGWRGILGQIIRTVLRRNDCSSEDIGATQESDTAALDGTMLAEQSSELAENTADLSEDALLVNSVTKGAGSILLSDLKLDLRQLLFGFVPILKRITPGGPLILEPFTTTVIASFNCKDVKESFLLDAGLRRLVARALRRRVRDFRDLMDGAVFYGRTWNMASKSAPMVEVPQLTSVEFDNRGRLIMTGIAQVRTSPDAPFIENSFKVRTKIGTRKNGQVIRLEEPELALVLECPKGWERNIVAFCKQFNLPVPTRPEPIYSFFPIYSPFKVDDNDGFDLGDDNNIKSIEIKDGALRFELSAVLRPGRFLGNHYLAFTIPNRTFIITLDRVREGIKAARKNKRASMAAAHDTATAKQRKRGEVYRDVLAQSLSHHHDLVSSKDDLHFVDHAKVERKNPVVASPRKNFFSRFVEGYTGIDKEANERNERLTIAISDWFGRQGTSVSERSQSNAA